MSEQTASRGFNRLAWLLAPVMLAALLVAAGASLVRAHAAPALSGTYTFQASVNAVPVLSPGLSITGQLQLQVSGHSVQGQLCHVTITTSSSLLQSSLLNSGANSCLTVTGSVSGADAITMTVVNLLPGKSLLLSGVPNASLGTQGGLSGSLSLKLGPIQAKGSWSATLVTSAST